MKSLLLALILSTTTAPAFAETLAEQYSAYGKLLVVKMDTAQFPHPDRAKGHDYQKEHFTTEKNYTDNSIAIFVPKNFAPGKTVDFVIHFHGWRHHIETTFSEYKLIEQFSKSERNAILIVPQGSYDAADSFGGKFEDADGFKRFMDELMKTLRQEKIIEHQKLGEIILSGHSGGYHVMSAMLAKGGMSAHVKEVWIFDALYGSTEGFVNWFKQYPDTRFIDIYTQHGGTKEESENLMGALKTENPARLFLFKEEAALTPEDLKSNHLIFINSQLPHDEVVYKHEQFYNWLKTSSLASVKVLQN